MYLRSLFNPLLANLNSSRSIPAPPTTAATLLMHLNSKYGVVKSPFDELIQWSDISGNANHLPYSLGNKAGFISSVSDFGGAPGLFFDNSCYKTSSNFIGLNGRDKCTVYVVCTNPLPTSVGHVIEYSTAGTTSETDGFRQYLSKIGGQPYFSSQLKGNAGINGLDQLSLNPSIHAAFIKKGAPATDEIIQERYTTGGGVLVTHSSGSDNSNTFGSHPLFLGSSAPFGFSAMVGTIGCVLVYDDVLAGSDKSNLESWLRSQFSII